MAKRQNFIVGSTNGNTETQTVEQLNRAWDQYAVLHSGTLDGVFNAVSDYSNDSSNEIANAIQSITGSEPAGANQSELAGALSLLQSNIRATALIFKGYVGSSAPSGSTYSLRAGDLWIASATMPTSFPVAAASIKSWNGSEWVAYGSTYTPSNFHFFKRLTDNSTYFWLGGAWNLLTTNLSSNYFTQNASTGQWEIASNYNNTLVHKTGGENIDGAKIFSDLRVSKDGNYATGISMQSSALPDNYTTQTSSQTIYPVTVSGSAANGGSIGYMSVARSSDVSRISLAATARKTSSSDLKYAYLSIQVNGDGVITTDCPTPRSDGGNNQIATTGWANDAGSGVNNIVHKSGNENINGDKTFGGTIIAGNGAGVRFNATRDVYTMRSAGSPASGVSLLRDNDTNYTAFNASGNAITIGSTNILPYSITPATSDSSTRIATTKFVKDVLNNHYITAFQKPTASNNYTWYRKYADGWIEQGGHIDGNNATTSVTFPVAMADNNYCLNITIVSNTENDAIPYYAVGARTKSTTGFTTYNRTSITKDWMVAGMAAS